MNRIVVLFASVLVSLAACTHADELEEVRRDRSPSEAAGCLEVVNEAASPRIGKAHDFAPETAAVEFAVRLRVRSTCAAGNVRVGLCERNAEGQPVAPALFESEVPATPGQELQVVVTLAPRTGTQWVCAELHKLQVIPVERVCEGAEQLCVRDASCWSDTQENPLHCGSNCNVCPAGEHGQPACVAGRCALRCEEGFHYEQGRCRPRPACAGLERACSGDDCCAVDAIASAGNMPIQYVRGYDPSGDQLRLPEAQPASEPPVVIDPFLLDRYEVTVARFRRFVDDYDAFRASGQPRAGQGAHPRIPASGWREEWNQLALPRDRAALIARVTGPMCRAFATFREQPSERDALPINCVDFYVAYLYCIWDGDRSASRLPTEAEWNAGAAGGDEQRAYPWSMPAGSLDFEERSFTGAGDREPFPAGSFPRGVGRWGTHDLAGNVYEWVRDTSEPKTFDRTVMYTPGPANPLDLRADTDPSTYRPLRSGSFKNFLCPACDGRARLRTSAREVLPPTDAYNDTGIRCVRSYRD